MKRFLKMLVADVLATLMVILAFAADVMPTNESPTNLSGGATDDWRTVCALVHLNLSCSHPFRAIVSLWEQSDENEPNAVYHGFLKSRDPCLMKTVYGCTPWVPKSRWPYRTRFSVKVSKQNCVADWESDKERWLVGSQWPNQTYQEYNMRLELTPHSNAEVEVKTAELLSMAAHYCIKAHIVLSCAHAFTATVQIRTGRAEPKPTGYVVAEKKLGLSREFESDIYFVVGKLNVCIPWDEVNFSSHPSAFYLHATEHTCPEAHYETVELPHAMEVKEYGVILYFSDGKSFSKVEANIPEELILYPLSLLTVEEFARQISEEPVRQRSTYQTDVDIEADIDLAISDQ